MTKPVLHLNGSGRDNLLEGYMEMHFKLGEALKSLCANGPHGRDYLEPGTYTAARKEHEDRIDRVGNVLADIDILMEALECWECLGRPTF